MKQSGVLLIADLSNYTAFLTSSDLLEAQSILDDLVRTILNNTRPPLVVAKLEGDAVFAYAPQGAFVQGQTLLEAVEKIYMAFRQKREQIALNMCAVDTHAADAFLDLDLKFVIHHGEFVLSEFGDHTELSGPDVILTHRMVKNSITTDTGVNAYAFLTNAAIKALCIDDLCSTMLPHAESYPHLGAVGGVIHNLDRVWQTHRDSQPNNIAPQNVWFTVEAELPINPALAWDYLHEPERKRIWSQSDVLQVELGPAGRVGVGAAHRCAHGDTQFVHSIVDWQPFNYATFDVEGPLGSVIRYQTRIIETEVGCIVQWVWARPAGENGALHDGVVKLITPAMRFFFEGPAYEVADIIRGMVDEDISGGRIAPLFNTGWNFSQNAAR